ncbi:MAG: hypothetical protein AMXMBFR80_12700 [Dehalococcoidia bacterium]
MHPPDHFDRTSLRDRLYGTATTTSEGRRSLVAALFAASLFLLITAISVRQVTTPANALPVLQSGIAVVTDVNQLVADDAPRARDQARNSDGEVFTLPGYPLDVALSRSELLDLTDARLASLLVQRSAALVYADGLAAFDRTGEQSLDRFSSQGLLELAVSQVSQSTHDRATLAAAILALSTAGLGALFAATGEGWGRLRGLGLAIAVGSVPGLLLFGALWWLAGRLGAGDPFESDLREIVRAVFEVPLRNYSIVLATGLALVAASIVLALIERRLAPAPLEDAEDDYTAREDFASGPASAD